MIHKPSSPITIWKVGDPLPPGWAGVPVGSHGDELYFSNEQIHALIVGTTGSGKTQKIIFPMIYGCGFAGESMIITDPKGEIHRETSGFLAQQGYDIIVLNLRDTFRSDSWNIIDTALKYHQQAETAFAQMEACDDKIEKARLLNEAMRYQQEAFEYVNEVAYAITHQHESKDPFWDNAAQGVLTSILFSLVKGKFADEVNTQANAQRRNVYSAVSILNSYAHTEPEQSQIHAYMQTLPTGDSALNAYSVISRSGAQTGGSIYTTLSTATQIFTDQGIAQITAKSERTCPHQPERKIPFDLKEIGLKKTAVYVIFPDEKASRGLIPSLFVDACYKELVATANEHGGSTPVRVNMILDEFAQFPKIADLEKKLAVARSRGIRFSLIIQGFNQLDKVYGKEVAGIIRENCNLTIYLLSGDYETAERISKLIGKQTIKKSSISMGSDERSTVNLSTDLVQRDLMMPEEILRLGTDVCLVLLTGRQPMKAPVDYYYRMPCLQRLKRPEHPLPMHTAVEIDPFSKTMPVFDFLTLKNDAVALKQAITDILAVCQAAEDEAELLDGLQFATEKLALIAKADAKNALPPHILQFIARQQLWQSQAACAEHVDLGAVEPKRDGANNIERVEQLLRNHPFFRRYRSVTITNQQITFSSFGKHFTFNADQSLADVAEIFLQTEKTYGQPPKARTIARLQKLKQAEDSLASLIELLQIDVQFPEQSATDVGNEMREMDLLTMVQGQMG